LKVAKKTCQNSTKLYTILSDLKPILALPLVDGCPCGYITKLKKKKKKKKTPTSIKQAKSLYKKATEVPSYVAHLSTLNPKPYMFEPFYTF
jgi:hypothetical protein